MTDPREPNPGPEIVDLPPSGRASGSAVAPPGSTVGTRFGDAPVVDPSAPSAAMRPGLAAPGRKATVRAGDGRQIVCEGLVRIYKVADLEVVALQGLDLVVGVGEMIAIVGASGSGKSTLLNILGGLDTPSAGRAVVAGHDLGQMGRRERTRYRRRVVGMIWQQTARNLLPYLTAQENVELPMTLDGRPKRSERAKLLLELVGLGERLDHRPERLSGGEQQRVAIAVALANEPDVLFADEPTGELDTSTSHEIFGLLRRVNEELGTTIVIVTHDPLVSEQVQRTVAIRDGRTSTETVRRSSYSDTGEHTLISEEFAVLDRAGRLQLPKAHVAALGLKDPVVGLMAGSVLLISTSTASDMQQDRSTGWRLGTNRAIQFRYQVAGILMGALMGVAFAKLFMASYPVLLADQTLMKAAEQPANWSSAMTYKFVGILRSLTDPKPYQITAIWVGVGLGFAIQLARKLIKGNAGYRKFVEGGRAGFATDFVIDAILLPSPYASSFGGFVNLNTSMWFGVGGIVSSFFNTLFKPRPVAGAAVGAVPDDMSSTSLFGGGLIAGDALAALAIGIFGLLSTVFA